MSDLENILNENTAPDPRASLSARILAAAESAEPANDVRPTRSRWAMGGLAAMAIMAALFVMQPLSGSDGIASDETAPEIANNDSAGDDMAGYEVASNDVEWDQIADASGFADLYLWVEGDDS